MSELSEAHEQHTIMDHEGIPPLGTCDLCGCVHGLPFKLADKSYCKRCGVEMGADVDMYERHRLRDRRKKR